MRKKCVNALNRAPLISTVHSGNPLFTRLPRSVFVNNSQNILIISVLNLFFWLDHFGVKIFLILYIFTLIILYSGYQNTQPFYYKKLLITNCGFL